MLLRTSLRSGDAALRSEADALARDVIALVEHGGARDGNGTDPAGDHDTPSPPDAPATTTPAPPSAPASALEPAAWCKLKADDVDGAIRLFKLAPPSQLADFQMLLARMVRSTADSRGPMAAWCDEVRTLPDRGRAAGMGAEATQPLEFLVEIGKLDQRREAVAASRELLAALRAERPVHQGEKVHDGIDRPDLRS